MPAKPVNYNVRCGDRIKLDGVIYAVINTWSNGIQLENLDKFTYDALREKGAVFVEWG